MTQQFPPQQPYGQQPYGEQPYGRQPHGPQQPQQPYGPQQPYQQQVQPYGQQNWSPGYPPPPKSKKPVIIGSVAAAVVVLGVITLVIVLNQGSTPSAGPRGHSAAPAATSTSAPAGTATSSTAPTTYPTETSTAETGVDHADAGDCIKVNSASTNDADVETIDCSSPDAVYKVGTRLFDPADDCPSDSYDKYTQSGGTYSVPFGLCLMLNAQKGDCFANLTDTGDGTARVRCSDADAEGKVIEVVTGQASDSACPSDTGLALVYPEPGETVCLVEVANA